MTFISTWFRTLRTALPVMAGLAVILSSPARADDVFTVSDVKVDVTAENAVAAREKAFAEAEVKALTALAQKLLGEADFARYKAPEATVISGMIKDFEITDERLSAVQYIGTYTFRFEGDAVRQHFNVGGMHYSDVQSKPVLVLPFYKTETRMVLWQDENPWLAAWAKTAAGAGGLVPVAVPMGDIRDVGDIGDNEALTYRRDGLDSILQRYNAGEAIILIAAPEQSGVSVTMYRTDRRGPEFVRTLHVAPDPEMDADGLYAKAVKEVRATIQSDWKTETAINPVADQNNAMTIRVHFDTMQQWVETRQALRRVAGVTEMKVLSVTPREAQVVLRYAGDENRLRLAMAQVDLVLGQQAAGGDVAAYGYVPAAYDVFLKKYTPF